MEIKHLDQYGGVWAMHLATFNALLDHARHMDLAAHQAQYREQEQPAIGHFETTPEGAALICISGPITKYGSSMSDMPHGLIGARKAIRDAAANPSIKGIVLHIDSPGGTVAGITDCAEDILRARAVKPVIAFVEDMGASAAYWLASQADRVIANTGAAVGSIGVYNVVSDWSKFYETQGVAVTVIKSGAFKGVGVEGAPVEDEHKADIQRVVDSIHGLFVGAVNAGRKRDLSALADGRVWIGEEALALGLVDQVGTLADAIGAATKTRGSVTPAPKENRMAAENQDTRPETATAPVIEKPTQPAQPAAASFAEIKAECVGATPAFICAQMESAATLPQARSAWMKHQNDALAAAQAQSHGVPPLSNGGKPDKGDTGGAVERWNAAIAAQVARGKTKQQAVSAVVKSDPDLHAAFIAEYNADRGRAAR